MSSVKRRFFSDLCGTLALGSALSGCAKSSTGQVQGGSLLADISNERLWRNMGSFTYAPDPMLSGKEALLHILWSPSCRDSMRFYRYGVKSALPLLPKGSVKIAFTVVPRSRIDIETAVYMRSFSEGDYWKIALAHLETGAAQDRFLTPEDTHRIAHSLQLTPETKGQYDADLARRLAIELNIAALKESKTPETPIVFLNQLQISTEEAKRFLSSLL